MDALLLLACVLACPIIIILTGALLLYIVPVRSSIRLLVNEGDVRETFMVAWGLAGVRIRHDSQGTSADVMGGRYVFYTQIFEKEEGVSPSPKKPEIEDLPEVREKEGRGGPSFPMFSRTIRLARSLIRVLLGGQVHSRSMAYQD